MIPREAHDKLATRLLQWHKHDPDSQFVIEGSLVNELQALILRLADSDKMSADERRDWMNLLHTRLTNYIYRLD